MLSSLYGISYWIFYILIHLFRIYSYVFIADAVLSWFLKPDNTFRKILIFLTEPFVSLFRPLERKIVKNSGFPISLSHLFAFFSLQILQSILSRLIVYFY